MDTLNYWVGVLLKMQLMCHGKKPLYVVLPDGTRMKVSKVWETNKEVFMEIAPE